MNIPAPLQARKVQVALLAVVILGGGALGAYTTGILGGNNADPAPAEHVPDGVDMVVYVDGDIITDSVTKATMNNVIEQSESDEVNSYDEFLTKFENESNLSYKQFDEMMMFSKTPDMNDTDTLSGASVDNEYVGLVLHTDWSEDTFVETATSSSYTEYNETTYNGHTVYKPASDSTFGSDDWIGVLGNGNFVIGSEQAVKDGIDVKVGDKDAFSGALRTEYENLDDDGYIKFAVNVPADEISEDDVSNPNAPVNTNVYANMEMVSGVYSTAGEDVTIELTLTATDKSSASDMTDVTDGALSLVRGSVTNETVKNTLKDVTVTQDGSRMTITYSASLDTITELFRVLSNYSPYAPYGPTYAATP